MRSILDGPIKWKHEGKHLPSPIATIVLLAITTILLWGITISMIQTLEVIRETTTAVMVTPETSPVAQIESNWAITAEVSAYTPRRAETDDTPHITASGARVKDGVVACPDRFPFGTIIEIRKKKYVCLDRMNRRYADGNYFDIFMWELEDALNWGRRNVTVKIYEHK